MDLKSFKILIDKFMKLVTNGVKYVIQVFPILIQDKNEARLGISNIWKGHDKVVFIILGN